MRKCYKTGKQMFLTRAPAEMALRRLNQKNHSNCGSVYLCQFCHTYHITHWGYEAQEYMDRFMKLRRRKNKKQMRSERTLTKRIKETTVLPRYKIPFMTIEEVKAELERRIAASRDHDTYIWNDPDFTKLRHRLNLCFLLADVIDSWLIDIVPKLKQYSTLFSELKPYDFSHAKSLIGQANMDVKRFASILYDEHSDTDQACIDSDWLKDLLWLINDRIDDKDTEATQLKMLSMIKNSFKSKYKLT